MMHDKAMRSLSALCLGLVCGAFTACAGSDIPPTDEQLEAAIAQGYGSGSTGTAGGSGGSAGRGGSGGTSSSNGGSAQTTAGAAGSGDEPAAGAGGSSPGGAAGSGGEEPDPGTGGDACDGFTVLQENCNGPSCHGAGSGLGNFAESEEDALTFVGESGTASCASEGPLLDPENPRQSIIVQKVNGTVPCGGPMPIGGELTDEEITCLEDWIGSL